MTSPASSTLFGRLSVSQCQCEKSAKCKSAITANDDDGVGADDDMNSQQFSDSSEPSPQSLE